MCLKLSETEDLKDMQASNCPLYKRGDLLTDLAQKEYDQLEGWSSTERDQAAMQCVTKF